MIEGNHSNTNYRGNSEESIKQDKWNFVWNRYCDDGDSSKNKYNGNNLDCKQEITIIIDNNGI